MKPCKQCEHCGIYEEYWCKACRYRYGCRIHKGKTKEHKIESGCRFECTDIDFCTKKEIEPETKKEKMKLEKE